MAGDRDEAAVDLQGSVDHETSSFHLSNGFDMSDNTTEVLGLLTLCCFVDALTVDY